MHKKIVFCLLLIICFGSIPRESLATSSTTEERIIYTVEQLIKADKILADQTSILAKRIRRLIARTLQKFGVYQKADGSYSTSSLALLYGTTTNEVSSSDDKTTSPDKSKESDKDKPVSNNNGTGQASAYTDPEWFGTGDTSGSQDYNVPKTTINQDGTFSADLGAKIESIPGKSSAGSQKIYEEAYAAASGQKPLITSQYGRLGCAYAVATILERAGLSVGKPASLSYTPNLNEAIKKSSLFQTTGNYETAFSGAVQGDVVMSPTGGGRTGHTGICMDNTCSNIASNSSGQQKFIRNYTQVNWKARFGTNIIIYHAK